VYLEAVQNCFSAYKTAVEDKRSFGKNPLYFEKMF